MTALPTFCTYDICAEKYEGPHKHESKGGSISKHAPGRCDRGVHVEAALPATPTGEIIPADAIEAIKTLPHIGAGKFGDWVSLDQVIELLEAWKQPATTPTGEAEGLRDALSEAWAIIDFLAPPDDEVYGRFRENVERVVKARQAAMAHLPGMTADGPWYGLPKLTAEATGSEPRDRCAVVVCGHAREDHYTYSLNGRDQGRCRSCDPHSGRRHLATNVAMDSDSHEAAMYLAADHDFEPAS